MNPKYNSLFQPFTLNNGVEIKNRLVVAPMTHFGSNIDGTLGSQEARFISNRAGDIGLFIHAATLVADGGKAFHGQPEAIYASQIDSLRETALLVQKQGAKAILQIHHGGNKSVPELLNGKEMITASDDVTTGARAATVAEIEALIAAYANATELAIQAGFDGVEIHGANGYLLQQFYSAQTNQRTDEWGGSREKRMRFPLAVVDAVSTVRTKYQKNDFIIGYRFSPEEAGENGLTMEDTFALLDVLVNKPLQYLHISLHEFAKKARRGADSHLTRMQLVHERINGKLPLIGVGSLFTAEQINEAFNTGWAEFIALGKTVMINPAIATLIKEGREEDIITELDPTREDQYGMPDILWGLCQQGGAWLPPVKGQNDWKPLDI